MDVLIDGLSCDELLNDFQSNKVHSSELLKFETEQSEDAYNISPMFNIGGVDYIAARYEQRDGEDATATFCKNVIGL